MRGFTAAEVTDVVWRWDSRVVSVLTEHGTHHLFSIHPAGGSHHPLGDFLAKPGTLLSRAPSASIFNVATFNPPVFQPLSVSVATFEKIKPKHSRTNSFLPIPSRLSSFGSSHSPSSPGSLGHVEHGAKGFETATQVLSTSRHLTTWTFLSPRRQFARDGEERERVLSEVHHRFPSGLLYDPLTNSVTLYQFEIKKKLVNVVTHGVGSSLAASSIGSSSVNPHKSNQLSTSHSQVSAPSGLSQLMQKKLGKKTDKGEASLDPSNGSSSTNSIVGVPSVVWLLSCASSHPINNPGRHASTEGPSGEGAIVTDGADKTHRPIDGGACSSFPRFESPHKGRPRDRRLNREPGSNWSSFVELDTYSHSIHILPRSLYTSYQFDFYHLASSHAPLSRLDFENLSSRKVVVRREVLIEPGDIGASKCGFEEGGADGMRTIDLSSEFVNDPVRSYSSSSSARSPRAIFSKDREKQMIYAEPIRSALETILDGPSPRSPGYICPGFPNGHAGKTTTSYHSIMSFKGVVPPMVGAMNGRVWKELGKINHHPSGPDSWRRISTGTRFEHYYQGIGGSLSQKIGHNIHKSFGGQGVSVAGETSSVSFDEDEVIRIENSGQGIFDDQAPSSSSMTSFTTSSQSNVNPGEAEMSLQESENECERPDGGRAGELDRWDGWSFEDEDFDFDVPSVNRKPTVHEVPLQGYNKDMGYRPKGRGVKLVAGGARRRLEEVRGDSKSKSILDKARNSSSSGESSSGLSTSTSMGGEDEPNNLLFVSERGIVDSDPNAGHVRHTASQVD